MGVSTDAIICFGVSFEEGTEFPWDDPKWDEMEDWWLEEICKFKPPFEIYDEHGEYLNGVTPPEERVDEYHKARDKFSKEHPLPVELVSHCHCDYPMYILAVKGTVQTASRGYPMEFFPAELIVSPEQREVLMKFCEVHGLEASEPKWWLASDWC